jgi:DNA repair ATPase RecN
MKRAALALCLFVGPVWAASYTSCRSDLDGLKRQSDEAADKARDAADAEDELEECRSSKGIVECSSKLDNYESAKDSLQSALEDVALKVRAASSSCGFDLTQPVSMDNVNARFCKVLNHQRMYLPPAVLLNECKKVMTEEECKRCLGIK